MSTVADLTGEINLNANPFISATRGAENVWVTSTDKMIAQGQKMARVLDNVFVDAAGKWRNSLGQFTLDPIEKAFKTLGVTSQATLNKTAQDAVAAFNIIKNSGTSSAHDVQNAYQAMQKSINAANQDIGKNNMFEGLGAKIKSAAGEMQIFGGVITAVFGGAITYATKASSDLSEAMNKVDVVFGSASQEIKDFAASSASSLGLSRTATLDYAGSLGNMFTAMKLSQGAAGEMSKGILALAADIASFNNINVTEALDKLKSGLQGEAEPLRSVGVLLSDVAIKAKATELGIAGASSSLSEQQKVLLRYLVILDQTENAQGDFARTATGMANSSRILAAQFEDLAAKLGDKFATAGNTAVGIAVQLMSVLNNLPSSIMGAAAAFLTAGAAIGAVTLAVGTVVAVLGGPLTLALTGIVAIAGAVAIGISQNWEAIVEMTEGMGISVGGSLRKIVVAAGYLVDIISAVARNIIQAFDVIVSGAKIMANGVIAAFKILAGSLTNVLSAIVAGDMVGLATALSTGFTGALQTVGASMSADMSALMGRVSKTIVATGEFLGGKTARTFGEAFDKGVESAKSFDFAKLKQKILDELKGLQAAAEKAGKGAGKGAGEAAAKAAQKAAMDSVNEMLDTLKAGVKISKDYWDRMSDDQKSSLTAQSVIVRKFNDELKDIMLDRVLNEKRTVEVSLFQWKRLSDGIKKEMSDAGIAIKIAFPKILSSIEEINDGIRQGYVGALEVANAATKRIFAEIIDVAEDAPKPFLDAWGIIHDKFFKAFADALIEIKEKTRSALGDGIGGTLVRLGEIFKINQQDIAKWAGNIGDVVRTIPGKFGDMVRGVMSTLNQWMEFGNSVLKILHDLNDGIPGSIGGIVEKVIGIFKSKEGEVAKAGANIGTSFMSSLAGSLTQGLGGIASIIGGGSLIGKGGLGSGILGGAIAGVGANLSLMSILGMAGLGTGPLGWAIMGGGALIGGLIGLFKKKSPEQKKAEEDAAKIGAANIQQSLLSVESGIVDLMGKFTEVGEKIRNFVEIPKKQMNRFMNALQDLLMGWLERTKQFKTENLGVAKEVSENLGSSLELLLGGAALIDAIAKAETITKEQIQKFVQAVFMIEEEYMKGAMEIDKATAKHSGKIATLLGPTVDFLQSIPAIIKAAIETPEITLEQAQAAFRNAKTLYTELFAFLDSVAEYALTKLVKAAEKFAAIAGAGKEIFDLAKLFTDYKPMADDVFAPIDNDFTRIQTWLESAVERVGGWLTTQGVLGELVFEFAAQLNDMASALNSAASGGGQNLTFEQSLLAGGGSNPLGLTAAGSSGSALSGGNAPQSINLHFHGPVLHDQEFKTLVRRAIEENERRWL